MILLIIALSIITFAGPLDHYYFVLPYKGTVNIMRWKQVHHHSRQVLG